MNQSQTGIKHSGGWHKPLLIVLVVLATLLSSVSSIDSYAEEKYQGLFQRALVSFALARTLNGVISAVQGTEVALQPAGVGVTLTPGQILDPVNDLVERFSWIMLGATISLGVQQVLLDMGQWWLVRVLVAVSGLLWLMRVLWVSSSGAGSNGLTQMSLRIFVLLLFIRFAVPAALILNERVYDLFLESRYVQSTQALKLAGEELEKVSEAATETNVEPSDESGLSVLGRFFESSMDSLNFKQRVEQFRQKTADLLEHLINLSVVFILQTALLPIAFLWLLLAVFRFLIRPRTLLSGAKGN